MSLTAAATAGEVNTVKLSLKAARTDGCSLDGVPVGAGELVVGDVHVDHEGELGRALPAGLLLRRVPRHLYL